MSISEEQLNRYYRYALALTNHDDEAYDLVHEAIVNLRGKFVFKVDAYIIRSIRNLFINKIKRSGSSWQELEEHSAVSQAPNPELGLELEQILAQLKPEERELLFLVEVEGYTYREIAKITGVKQGTLLSKLHRLKERLAKWRKDND